MLVSPNDVSVETLTPNRIRSLGHEGGISVLKGRAPRAALFSPPPSDLRGHDRLIPKPGASPDPRTEDSGPGSPASRPMRHGVCCVSPREPWSLLSNPDHSRPEVPLGLGHLHCPDRSSPVPFSEGKRRIRPTRAPRVNLRPDSEEPSRPQEEPGRLGQWPGRALRPHGDSCSCGGRTQSPRGDGRRGEGPAGVQGPSASHPPLSSSRCNAAGSQPHPGGRDGTVSPKTWTPREPRSDLTTVPQPLPRERGQTPGWGLSSLCPHAYTTSLSNP